MNTVVRCRLVGNVRNLVEVTAVRILCQRSPSVNAVQAPLARTYTSHSSSSPPPKVQRRLIVACDGTGKSSTRGSAAVATNVGRFCQALLPSSLSTSGVPTQQIVFYQSGVGTGSLGSLSSFYRSIASGTGLGLDDHVLDAFMFVANNYVPGDEIAIFGFSRGAFTARVLAGLICRLGLFERRYLWELKTAYAAYRRGEEAFERYVKDLHSGWKRKRTRKVKIKVLGCWDTVGSVGILPPYEWVKRLRLNENYEFYDPKLPCGVENAFHALALDEIRHPFTPTMWHLPTNESSTPINLEQTWFPGVHSNVGGGYADTHLADLSLFWLVSRCAPFLSFCPRYLSLVASLHRQPASVRSNLRKQHGFDTVYPGWARGRVYDSYSPMRVLGWRYRTPGGYGQPGGEGAVEGLTNESMHPSVRARWEADETWRPKALDGFKAVKTTADGVERWSWAKEGHHGRVEIPEASFVNAHEKEADATARTCEAWLRWGVPKVHLQRYAAERASRRVFVRQDPPADVALS